MKLQKFRKNRKQKGIAIGCVIALLLTIAGVNLYRTFALYKEEKTFNVLRGVVPDFSSITITYNVNGKTETTPPGKSDNYKVSVSCDGASGTWNSSSWELEVTNKTKKEITCTVTFTKLSYEDPILNGADPVISGDLVAVIVNPNTGEVTKADTNTEWYNYEKKQWANAIIPTSSAKSAVAKLSTGATINEDQIQSYFVWIPKYKYKLFNLNEYDSRTEAEDKSNQAIEIVFGTENTDDSNENECTTPKAENASGNTGSCKEGDYMTHPAFLAFGGNGLWVGKFETGRKSGALTSSKTSYSTSDLTEIVVKPNQYAWTYTNVSTMYQLAYNYQRSLDSHMMKNTEWGAVAYLTQSIYGRCSNETTCEEVTINNNSNYVTGFAGWNVSQDKVSSDPEVDTRGTYSYKNSNSTKASTTGNYTGIYDMSGGAYEYVMGVVFDSSGIPLCGNSDFTDSNFPKVSKFYDKYNYKQRILGDATAETDGWYSDSSDFVNSSNPWFRRGGYAGNKAGAGVFYFASNGGTMADSNGFRVSLAVKSA